MKKQRLETTKERRRLSVFARRLFEEWQRRGWPVAEAGVVLGVSGGADSLALLLAFDELSKVGRITLRVTVAHLNHGLRGAEGEADALWVSTRARELGFEAVVGRASIGVSARQRRDNLEQAARHARYRFLHETARARGAWAVVVAHTSDDQAETVLLRLLRGSGAEGLSGMRPSRVLDESQETAEKEETAERARDKVLLVRPLLGWARRLDAENYCAERGVEFRVDEMNEDERFARVRVRRKLLPLLETFNPRVVEALARTAGLLADDSQALKEEAAKLLDEAVENNFQEVEELKMRPLRIGALLGAHRAVRRRALRQWIALCRGNLRRVEMVHVRAIERLLDDGRGGRRAELPDGSVVERRRKWLWFHARS